MYLLGLREHEDILTSIHFAIENLHWSNIVIFGSSQGAASSLIAIGKLSEKERDNHIVSCVIAENPFSAKNTLWKQAVNRVLSGAEFGKSNAADHSLTSLKIYFSCVKSF